MASLLAFAAFALLQAAPPAIAPEQSAEAQGEKMSTLLVFGNDPCPRGKDDEIVVCARLPENERYRIPRRLRRTPDDAAQQSWASRVQALEYIGRVGTPNSCSPVGTAGQTGCYQQFLRIAREERRAAQSEAKAIP